MCGEKWYIKATKWMCGNICSDITTECLSECLRFVAREEATNKDRQRANIKKYTTRAFLASSYFAFPFRVPRK